jgi:hypothetical protein
VPSFRIPALRPVQPGMEKRAALMTWIQWMTSVL